MSLRTPRISTHDAIQGALLNVCYERVVIAELTFQCGAYRQWGGGTCGDLYLRLRHRRLRWA